MNARVSVDAWSVVYHFLSLRDYALLGAVSRTARLWALGQLVGSTYLWPNHWTGTPRTRLAPRRRCSLLLAP